ncbi:hypothetical protein FSP39_006824 [Pinctada imbricata]|uniref:Flavin-containing monooxygenase n=1 Tax=Pinctada imbricata TaxID=66713 RepID=A0AA88XKR1_PINIB|nr:hypothetical protein FSP39_006824 [Pinctada imbricata]
MGVRPGAKEEQASPACMQHPHNFNNCFCWWTMSEKIRVCVIGAGPAGCCALRHLTAESDKFEAVSYERNIVPGGVWAYTDRTGKDETGLPVHSAMYDKLKINVPKELQEFPGFPYPKEWKTSYISRQQCLQYINNFIDHFNIRKNIKLHIVVRDVSPIEIPGSKKVKWNVVISDTRKMDDVTTEIFDFVFVCIGHDSNEYIPNIPGMEDFKGKIMHSRNYRHAELFEGLDVALLGIHYTGEDVSMQIARFARKVYACHDRDNFPPSFPSHIEQHKPFKRMTKNGIVLPDGKEVKVDVVMFCTGYRYSYPFLKNDIIQVNDERITPIYKHMIHIKYPSLIFFNIPRQWSYFPHFNEFAKLAVRIADGRVKLPTEKEMIKDSEDDYQKRLEQGLKPRYAHYMGDIDRQWGYNKDLAKMGGFEPLPPVLEKLWDDVMDERYMNITHNTEFNYEITGKDSYKILNPEGSKTRLSKASG